MDAVRPTWPANLPGSLRWPIRFASALIVALAGYFCYGVLLVPLLEPTAPESLASRGAAAAAPELQLDLRKYFRNLTWQADAKVIETAEGAILFEDDVHEGDRITLKKLAMVLVEKSGTNNGWGDQPLILETEEGAVLETLPKADGELIGEIVSAVLKGQVVIRRPAAREGTEELKIVTKDVRIERDRIWTLGEVQFSYGPHWGVGEELEIGLAPTTSASLADPEPAATNVPAWAGGATARPPSPIRHVQVARIKTLVAQVGGKTPLGAEDTTPVPPGEVELTASGPFRLLVNERLATLERDIVVAKKRPDKVVEQRLFCDRVELHFQDSLPPPTRLPPTEDAGGGELVEASVPSDTAPSGPVGDPLAKPQALAPQFRPALLIATGSPVRIEAPLSRSELRAQELRYDFDTRRLTLAGAQGVVIHSLDQTVTAAQLDYQFHPLDARRLGQLWAAGPGRVQGTMGRQRQPFSANWRGMLRILPQEEPGKHVVSLHDGVELDVGGLGAFRADTLHFYVFEVLAADRLRTGGSAGGPQAPGDDAIAQPRASQRGPAYVYYPESLLASNQVSLDSPAIHVESQQVRVWFAPQVTAPRQSPMGRELAAGLPTGPAAASQPPLTARGDGVEVRLRYDEQFMMSLDELHVDGNVDVRRPSPRGPGFHLQGSVLDLRGDAPGDLVAHVRGAPAVVEAPGAAIESASIIFDQPANRIVCEGGGAIRIVPGDTAPGAGPSTLRWEGPMVFDGSTAVFQQGVHLQGVAASGGRPRAAGAAPTAPVVDTRYQFQTWGERLDIKLARPLSLSELESSGKQQVQVATVELQGDVRVENTTWQGGSQLSLDQLQTSGLLYNHQTGRLTAAGPGWASTTRMAAAGPVTGAAGATPGPATGTTPAEAGAPTSAAALLHYLRVEFQRQIEGDLRQLDVRCDEHVVAIYGPVPRWDGAVPLGDHRREGSRSIELRCNALRAAQVRHESRSGLLLEAAGNTHIQGELFDARAERLTYDQLRDLVVLEGDARSGAVLRHSLKRGTEPATWNTGRILFWPKSGNVEINEFRNLEVRP